MVSPMLLVGTSEVVVTAFMGRAATPWMKSGRNGRELHMSFWDVVAIVLLVVFFFFFFFFWIGLAYILLTDLFSRMVQMV